MINDPVTIQNKSVIIIEDSFLPILLNKLSKHENLIKDFESAFYVYLHSLNSNKDEKFVAENFKVFHAKILFIIENYFSAISTNTFNKEFESFIHEYDNFLPEIESIHKADQVEERFIQLKDDSTHIKFLKSFKKFFYSISQIPTTTNNLFKKLFKKPLKPKKIWLQNIPLKNLTEYFFKEKLSLRLLDEFENIYAVINKTSLNLLTISKKVSKNNFKKNNEDESLKLGEKEEVLNSFKNIISENLSEIEKTRDLIEKNYPEIIHRIFTEFNSAFQKTGTIELSKNKFNQNKIRKLHGDVSQKYKNIISGWQNNLFALTDQWRLFEELIIVNTNINIELIISTKICREKFNDFVLPKINSIGKYLELLKTSVLDFRGDKSQFQNLLSQAKENNTSLLTNKIVPQTIEILLDQNIPTLIDEFDVTLNNLVQNLSKKIAIVKEDKYQQKLKTSDLDFISPHEIISTESLPKEKKSTQKIKNEIIASIDKIQKNILDLDQIADFNLESALVLISEEDKNVTDSRSVALEGLERALSKTEETIKSIKDLIDSISDKLALAANEFNESIMDLTNSEKVFQIKLRIAKVKAVERTRLYKTKAINYVKNFVPIAISKTKETYFRSTELYANLKKKLGIISPIKSISSEVSDFLAETQNSIAKLPFVYQRLFKVEALTEERFFEARIAEITQLDLAFNNWLKGYFAPAVIVGEKGSGTTSLINIFLKEKK